MKKTLQFVLAPAIAGLVFALAVLFLPPALQRLPGVAELLSGQAPEPDPVSAMSYSPAIKRAAPAVVSINSKQQVSRYVERPDLNNPFRRVWERIVGESNSLGSGVIISADGYIITSYHIFFSPGSTTEAHDTTVTLNDGRTLEARRLVMDEENDLALLKVDADNLPFIQAGPANTLEVGDVVLAIGNPRNIGQSVSLGIISALLRRDDSFVIQTDAAINPGNSGGALIDVHGRLIGINSTIVSESGGSEGIGFATAAGKAINLMESYIESGPSGHLGVDSELIRIQVHDQVLEGFRVVRTASGGPADQAGIEAGDIITAVNDIEVDASSNGLEFIKLLSSFPPGETVNVRIYRNGEFRDIAVTLGVGEPLIYPYREYEDEPSSRSVPDQNGDNGIL